MTHKRRAAILFGINYDASPPSARLRGCVHDVENVSARLRSAPYAFGDVRVFTDKHRQTTALGLLQELHLFAARSWRESLDVAWIHFSGHGCSVRDLSGDEADHDGMDECKATQERRASIRSNIPRKSIST